MDDFDFDKFGEQFDELAIVMEEGAKIIVPMYIAYRKTGLPAQEAAAITAAMVAQTMPIMPQTSKED